MSESETREEAMKKYLTQKSVYDTTYEFDPATAFDAAKSAQSEQSQKQKRYMEKEEIKFQEATDKAIADFEGALK